MNEHWIKTNVKRGSEALASILPIIEGRGYVAGSYAAYMVSPALHPIRPNDIDVFATSKDNALAIDKAFFDAGWSLGEVSSIAIERKHTSHEWPVQIIDPDPAWQSFPDDVLNSFDFDVCRALLIDEAHVLADENAGRFAAKVLRIRDPLRSLKRAVKYQARGVRFSDHELLKLFLAWEQYDPAKKQARLDLAAEAEHPEHPPDYSFGWDEDEYYEGE